MIRYLSLGCPLTDTVHLDLHLYKISIDEQCFSLNLIGLTILPDRTIQCHLYNSNKINVFVVFVVSLAFPPSCS